MSESPTPPSGPRWRFATAIAALGVALAGFGGLVLPRMASDGIPPSLAQANADDPVVIRREQRRQCKKPHGYRAVSPPSFISAADR